MVFQQEMFSRSTSDYKIVEIPLVLKYALTKKFSFLIGPKVDIINYGFYNEKKVSIYSTMGIQYEVSKSLLLDARFNYRFTNESPIKTDYTFDSKASFTLGSKLKF
ncbi:hypothetical protein [Yeosuana aromativorans]|nr:hypothetical protein [Yeosuana aromativorans]